ncbi:hypothetical protein E1A91_A05G348100v1 [Gossypium mustelinum]|uniref:Small ribosomal subunit protein uS3c n=1 Tax=Gossypium mustelinum TaxID=34275 RepID=A0A5D2ZEF9_GOSMU|nr:hypothetical protein E1A91_A05G348100v1 [Gossypium mustelinum]
MGQKINPLGFRLGTTQSLHSLWFAQPKKYSEGLQEDKKIRDCIKNYVQKNMRLSFGVKGIARIEIQKILDLIQNRVSFRKVMKKAIELTEQADTKGIQIQIAGRIDRKEIARVEWIRKGRVPLQTIGMKIEYCSYRVRTIYGVLGIKIWIFINEE